MLKTIGLMSGTSMDGIEAMLMETDGRYIIESKATESLLYSSEFQISLRNAEAAVKATNGNLKEAAKIFPSLEAVIIQSTNLHAEIVHNLLNKANINPEAVDLIGYHGQALYHNPAAGITIQVGDGQLLSDLTGITVINDFRSDDIANGGQGAPLAPLYHQALAVKSGYLPVAVVNCGGMANISIISGADNAQVMGFDTGPGNVLIDRYVRNKTGNKEFIDQDGKYGLKGIVNQDALNKLMDLVAPYLNKLPPKSLDSGDFHLIKELDDLSIYDACATLECFTALSIVKSLDILSIKIPKNWVLAGGGWKNPVITHYLKTYLPADINIKSASEIGWDSTYMEAGIFAYLAARSFYKLPISLPEITGAKIPSLGGTMYLAKNS